MGITYQLLGPVEVCGDSQLVKVGSGQQRVVLALLLLHANVTVPVDVLVDELWGDQPPSQPRTAVQAYVYRLRRLLAGLADGPPRLDTRPSGYALDVSPDQTDLGRWEELVATGESARTAGHLADGAVALRRALALWRGPALADLTTSRVRAAAVRLDERRWQVRELCVKIELGLGRHAALVPELEPLVAGQPFREGLAAHLMLALYRSGRRADALATYRRVSRRLAEELGIEPGAALGLLHEQILRADPALELAGPGPVADGTLIHVPGGADAPPQGGVPPALSPLELPNDVAALVGRAAELASIERLVTVAGPGPTPVVTIDGAAGVGKSALAIHAGHRVRDRFPDGQLYADLRGASPGQLPLPPVDVLARFLRSLGLPPHLGLADVDEAAARFRTLTAQRRVLVVLDGAASAAQVRPLVPAGPGCAVLVTSRRPLTTLDGATRVRLDRLPAADSVAMLWRLSR